MAAKSRVLVVLLICGILLIAAGEQFVLKINTFSHENIVVGGAAQVLTSSNWNMLEIPGTVLSLIDVDNPQQSMGVGFYRDPIRMIDTASKTVASFSTNFMFKQNPESYNGSELDRRGDGMTFAMVERSNWTGGVGSHLGMFPFEQLPSDPKLFAIEYDNFQNYEYEDPPENHVGLDIHSLVSVEAAEIDALGFKFWTGDTIYSWIDYNGSSHNLEVRVANTSARPASPLLQVNYNLYDNCAEEMFAGFSAGNGDAQSSYYITEWSFTSSGLPPKASGRAQKLGLTIGVVVGVVVLLTLAGLGTILFVLRRRRRYAEGSPGDKDLLILPCMPDHYSYKQLSVATKAFSEQSKLGEGGFGSVYKGVLPTTGSQVAVKRVNSDSKQGLKEFLAEVSIISQLRHRNVVQLMGYCRDRGKFLIVYELLPKGSLDKALWPKSPKYVLPWDVRMKILSGTAAALLYLHEGWKQQVIHRDIKSSNIMLDEEYNAKLGDFGLARLVDHSKNANTTLIAGTYGYLAPEAAHSGKFTVKTDVFAFGAVALEIACGRKAFDTTAAEDDIVLVDMVWDRYAQETLTSVVDRRLEGIFLVHELELVLTIGLCCSHPDAKARPSMRQVVQILAGDAPVPDLPATKPEMHLAFSVDCPAIKFKESQESISVDGSSTNASVLQTSRR